MNSVLYQHTPVLLHETITHLVTVPGGIYIDATFGRGNHTRALLNSLSADGQVIAFDKDADACFYGKEAFVHEKRFTLIHASFTHLRATLQSLKINGKVSGILFDLGISSPQLDDASRGFSFMRSGPLDMRMDQSQTLDAKTWLLTVDEKTLADVLWQYGEEKGARRIAAAIVKARTETPITTTDQLAEIIKRASRSLEMKHPATRSFQAIRIFINQEMQELEEALAQAYEALAVGGRLAVISFHSLEDRIVKQFIRSHEKGEDLPRRLPVKHQAYNKRLMSVGKPIKPSLEEVHTNPRARSAILRIAEKIS